jgi:hypothetical protein
MSSRLLALILAAGLQPMVFAQNPDTKLPQRFTAFAVSPGGVYTRAVATQVEVTVSRWSNADETARFIRTLKEDGPEELLDVVRGAKSVGTIRTPGNLAYDLRFAQQETMGDGVRRVVLITDRPISFWEAVNRPRSIDYPFTLIELRLKNGEGEGKLNLATRIDVSRSGKMFELENYDSQPIQLNEVKQADR